MAKRLSWQASLHDIALIKLVKPVNDVKPVPLYKHSDELGKIAKIYGKGATGNGAVGVRPNSGGKLRRAYNRVSEVHEQWLVFGFNCGAKALPLEGMLGWNDSGAPVLIKKGGEWKLAGVARGLYMKKGYVSKRRSGDWKFGVCGQDFDASRISYYAGWIDSVIDASLRKTPQ